MDIRLEGTLLKFQYQADEGAFAVAKIQGSKRTFIAIGPLGHVCVGQYISLTGQWKFHPSFGEQFQVQKPPLVNDPKSLNGLALYLSGTGIKGMGPKNAQRIVDTFGLETLDVLNRTPEKLRQVKGIGEKRLALIVSHWKRGQQSRELLAQLRGFGLGPSLCDKLLDAYGEDSLATIRRTPYALTQDIKGIGFKTADSIALANGVPKDSEERAKSALLHVLQTAEQQGHCFLPEADLIEQTVKLSVPIEVAQRALNTLLAPFGELPEVVLPFPNALDNPVYRSKIHFVEKRLAERLLHLSHTTPHSDGLFGKITDHKIPFEQLQQDLKITLNEEQRQAIAMAMNNGFSVITGGPGTGKTTIVHFLIAEASRRGERWLLAAPTGRAAKRMQEATGHAAQTVHRLLNFNGHNRKFSHDNDNPLQAEAILVDEASMLDIWLIDALIGAIEPGCRLILVGDVDQLPSVGPGQILSDIIQSGQIPVTRLSSVYRQARDSNIVRNAHHINAGLLPISSEQDPNSGRIQDFFLLDRETPQQSLDTLLHVVCERLPKLGFQPDDIQVLTPMHNGLLGTHHLNEVLQSHLNPTGDVIVHKNKRFRVGDRVLQVRNDYDNDIYNGDIGRVLSIGADSLFAQFEDRTVLLSGAQLNDLELAYAVSIHKSQGSEYPAVVVVVHKEHWILLRRNLLYTAVTRAKRFCCLIGSAWAMETAAQKQEGSKRHTGLSARLQGDD